MTHRNNLVIVVCGAGPASDVDRLINVAQQNNWATTVIATPNARPFVDEAIIEELTGQALRSDYTNRPTGAARTVGRSDALIIAPATFNTINKIASGIADSYALTSIAEHIGLGAPTVIVPFVNTALAARAPFQRSVDSLRLEGVQVVWGPECGWEPHAPGTGGVKQEAFPWLQAFDALRQRT